MYHDVSMIDHELTMHFQVSGIREQALQSDEDGDLTKTEIALMSMAGILSTAGVALAIPPVSRKIFGPHVGNHFTKAFPNIKLLGIYKRSKKKENIPSKKITSDSDHDPGKKSVMPLFDDDNDVYDDDDNDDIVKFINKDNHD